MIRILIVDDRNLVIQNLKGLIELEEELEVVGTAENGSQGIKLVEQLQPDVAIVDLTMPHLNGIETTYLITHNHPQTKVLIFTGADGRMLNQAILAGAKGYLLKSSSRENLIAAIYAVHRNSVYIGDGILDRVRLSSRDSQQKLLKQINWWLAKEVINWWREHSLSPIHTAEQIVENLSLDRLGLSWMRDYLCQQKGTELTLTEEFRLKVAQLFAQIEDAANPEQKLLEKKLQIFALLNRQNHANYLAILRNNFQYLQTITLEKLQKIISSLWQQAAPLPLLNCLQSVEKYLSNWQQFFVREYQNSQIKENAARHSLNYLLSAKNSPLDKQESCKKAVIFIYRCQINAELNNLLAQLVSKMIQQLKIYLNILGKANALLSESSEQLEQQITPLVIALTPFFERLQDKVNLKQLRRDFEASTGHSLNQWGVSESICYPELNHWLIEKLRPIATKIYSDLRKEALAISFLEYNEHQQINLS